jgi:hypothetical protein
MEKPPPYLGAPSSSTPTSSVVDINFATRTSCDVAQSDPSPSTLNSGDTKRRDASSSLASERGRRRAPSPAEDHRSTTHLHSRTAAAAEQSSSTQHALMPLHRTVFLLRHPPLLVPQVERRITSTPLHASRSHAAWASCRRAPASLPLLRLVGKQRTLSPNARS